MLKLLVMLHNGVDMIHGSEYYNTYYDVFGAETSTGVV